MKIFIYLIVGLLLLAGCSTPGSTPGDTSSDKETSIIDPAQTESPDISITPETPVTPGESPEETAETPAYEKPAEEILQETISLVSDVPIVFMTTDISPEGLMAVYNALIFESGKKPFGNVAVNVHTGESQNSFHLRPDFIKELIHTVNGTFVETNVAYSGRRASTAKHLLLAEEHGFTAVAPVDIMDANGYIEIPVIGGTHLSVNLVGASLPEYDFIINLSHFKGHGMGGFGGALKNLSIGLASREGKSWIHTVGRSKSGFGMNTSAIDFAEAMAEAAKSVQDFMGSENIIHINVLNNISVDCDCMANPKKPDMHDIGILASLDPVALDQASVDLIYAAPDGKSVVARIESRSGVRIIEHAVSMGFGSQQYKLVFIDG